MITLKTTIQDKTNQTSLGNVSLTISNMDYNKVISYILPLVLEKLLQSKNGEDKLKALKEHVSEKKDILSNAVLAAAATIPDPEKEALIVAAVQEEQIAAWIHSLLKKADLDLDLTGLSLHNEEE